MTYCWLRNDVFGIPLLKCTFLAREKSISNFENFYNSSISCSTTCAARLQYGSTAARNIFFYPPTKIEGFSNFRTKFRKISKIISEAAFHVRHILTSAMTSCYVLVSRESNRNWHKMFFSRKKVFSPTGGKKSLYSWGKIGLEKKKWLTAGRNWEKNRSRKKKWLTAGEKSV